MTESSDYSAQSLEGFLVSLGERDLMPKATVVTRRAACNKMLRVLSEEERADLRRVDIESVASRFGNLEGDNYKSESLLAYKSRLSKSISDFLRYKENPSKFTVRTRSNRTRQNTSAANAKDGSELDHAPKGSQQLTGNKSNPQFAFPVPIRADVAVQISGIPYDLSRAEAQKIANVILALSNEAG